MVKVTIKASVEVTDGQTAFFSSEIDPGTSVYSTAEVGEKPVEVLLFPAASVPILLAISAEYADGQPARLNVTPKGNAGDGVPADAFEVSGSLLVANQALLNKLLKEGPRGLTLALPPPEKATEEAKKATEEAKKATEEAEKATEKALVRIIAAIAPIEVGGEGKVDGDGKVDGEGDNP